MKTEKKKLSQDKSIRKYIFYSTWKKTESTFNPKIFENVQLKTTIHICNEELPTRLDDFFLKNML